MTDDSPVFRRRVLRTIGIGTTVVLAGCSGGGNESDDENPDSTESTTQGDSASTGTQNQSDSQTSIGSEENETPSERQFEQGIVNEFGQSTDEDYSFIEFNSKDVNLENKNKSPSGTPTVSYEENPYPHLTRPFRRFYSNNVDEGDDIVFGYSLTVQDGGTDLIFKDFAQSESADPVSDLGKFGFSSGGARSAIEKFFRENITGVKHVSERFPEDLLKLAQN